MKAKEPKNCIFCDYFKKDILDSYSAPVFVCKKANDRVIDATPTPQWCPLKHPRENECKYTEGFEGHCYTRACERGKLDV